MWYYMYEFEDSGETASGAAVNHQDAWTGTTTEEVSEVHHALSMTSSAHDLTI